MFNNVTTFWDFIIVFNFAFLLFVFLQDAFKCNLKLLGFKFLSQVAAMVSKISVKNGVNLDGEASTYFTVN